MRINNGGVETIAFVPGLVLKTTAGDPGAVHQHLARHHVLQAADVASAAAPSAI